MSFTHIWPKCGMYIINVSILLLILHWVVSINVSYLGDLFLFCGSLISTSLYLFNHFQWGKIGYSVESLVEFLVSLLVWSLCLLMDKLCNFFIIVNERWKNYCMLLFNNLQIVFSLLLSVILLNHVLVDIDSVILAKKHWKIHSKNHCKRHCN